MSHHAPHNGHALLLFLPGIRSLTQKVTVVRQMLSWLLQRRERTAEGREEDHADHRLRSAPGDFHHLRRQAVRLQDRLRRQGLGRLDILPAY